MPIAAPSSAEAVECFECFGGTCTVRLQGRGPLGSGPGAVERVRRRLLHWHAQFSRFDGDSELSRLNADTRTRVPVSPIMARFVQAAVGAASLTGGLVDPTLVGEIEAAGYTHDLPSSVRSTPLRGQDGSTASPGVASRWRDVVVDRAAGTVSRPVGVRLDSGGVAKGLFGDVLAPVLGWYDAFALDAAGDIVLGGAAGVVRPVQVASPTGEEILHTFHLVGGAVATSGITRRSWIDDRGRPAHHLLDPATGRPAFTGVVQATALAPSGIEAEARAKASVLAGPKAAAGWLRHGGVVVYGDGGCKVIEPRCPELQ